MQKVCYCDNGSGYTFWFEITNKNDQTVDYYYDVYKNAGNQHLFTGTGTILAGIGPSQTRLDYFSIDVPYSGVAGSVKLYRTCDDDFQASIGFNPPNFTPCGNGCYPAELVPDITLIADPSDCLYARPSDIDIPSELTAYVYDYSGGPIADGTDVTFTITSGPGEFRTPPEVSQVVVQTTNGVATLDLYQNGDFTGGIINITASVSTTSLGIPVYAEDSATVKVCPVCASISLYSDHAFLDSSVPSTRLVAISYDYSGNYMPEGFILDIVTTIGTISNITPTAYGVSGYETDLAATAILTYDPNFVPDVAIVTTSSICGAEGYLEIPFLLPPISGSIVLESIPNPVTLCGDSASTTIYATFFDDQGSPHVDETINFSIFSESVDNSSASLLPLAAQTDEDGIASTTLSNTEYETVTIKASYSNGSTIVSDPYIVVFQSSGPTTLTLSHDAISNDTCNGVPTEVTATVLDCSQMPVEGVTVVFSTTVGSLSSSSGITDVNGEVSTSLIVSGSVEQGVLTASIPNLFLADSAHISFIAGNPCTIEVIANPGQILADNTSISEITATVYDCCMNPVDGIDVCFSTTEGTLLYESMQDVTINGMAHIPLLSTFDPATALVTATLCGDGISDDVEVVFLPLPTFPTHDENEWNLITIQPLYNGLMSRLNLTYGCLLEKLPEEVPVNQALILTDIQSHISNVSMGGINFIYFVGELQSALVMICDLSKELDLGCCEI